MNTDVTELFCWSTNEQIFSQLFEIGVPLTLFVCFPLYEVLVSPCQALPTILCDGNCNFVYMKCVDINK